MKIEITNEIEKKIDINNTQRNIFYYKRKRIGSEKNDGKNHSINVRDGFSLKTIKPKEFPPKFKFYISSEYA